MFVCMQLYCDVARDSWQCSTVHLLWGEEPPGVISSHHLELDVHFKTIMDMGATHLDLSVRSHLVV